MRYTEPAMKLSVPFIPDTAFTEFLASRRQVLAAVYFPLDSTGVWDARIKDPGRPGHTQNQLAQHLSKLTGVDKYILVNTRFIRPDIYQDKRTLTRFLDQVAALSAQVRITGIVISDFYLLQALDKTGHPIVADLEAVPGINAMIDRFGKLLSCLDLIAMTQFRPPGRLLLDRSLNRDMENLSQLSHRIRQEMPDKKIELLANEGCLLHCPFKPAHDAHIALSNTGLVREATWQINRQFGCHDLLLKAPERFFSSPFIRPEDQYRYDGLADTIKLCGRTLGTSFLTRCITAYETRSHEGNLLDLMDAAHFLANHVHIDNKALDTDFFISLTTCTNKCKACTICQRLFQNTARRLSIRLTSYKDIK